jgi:hypothetical protein
MATDAPAGRRVRPARGQRARPRGGSDRWTVMLLTIAAVLTVFALLVWQLPATRPSASSPVRVLRKIYRTTVVETVRGGGGPSGTSVSQSVQSSGASLASAPATRTS